MRDRLHINYLIQQVAVWLLLSPVLTASAVGQSFFQEADQFFRKYVQQGRVDYQAIKQNRQGLKELSKRMADYPVNEQSATTQKAFWINAYNLTVIKGIIRHYPISSPMELEGFFEQTEHHVANQQLTLDAIEDQKLLQQFEDARLHFVLVCAAQGCPLIVDYAYTPERLDEQMEERTRQTLNDPEFIRVRSSQEKVLISELFKWYKKDFVTEDQTVIDYINQYRTEKIPDSYQVDYYRYDWSLNDTKKN